MTQLDKIIEIICTGEGTNFDIISEDNRKEENVYCRQLIMYFAKTKKLGSFQVIGNLFRKDHATVIHAVNTIKNYIETDRYQRNKIEEYSKKIDDIDRINLLKKQMTKITGELEKELSALERRTINIRLSIDNIMNQIDNK